MSQFHLKVKRGFYVALTYRAKPDMPEQTGFMGENYWDVPVEIESAVFVPVDKKEEIEQKIRAWTLDYVDSTLKYEFIPVVETVTRLAAQNEGVDAVGNDMMRDHDYALHLLTNASYLNVKTNMFLMGLLNKKPEEVKSAVEGYVSTHVERYRAQVATAARLGVMDILAGIKSE